MAEPQPPLPTTYAERFKVLCRDVGVRAALLLLFSKIFRVPLQVRLRNPLARHPLWCRSGASDLQVFRQIFCLREYSCLDDLVDPRLIIDCGANVGYSSAYFLSRFPAATVIAVEPDPGNYEMLQKNLAPYAGRFSTICSGIWPISTGLKISKIPFRDGKEWSVSVCEAQAGEKPEMMGVNIGDLLAGSAFERISILKIDIEGAETLVFSSNYEQWLSKVDNLSIELHDESAERAFSDATAGERFATSHFGELTICRRKT